METMIRPNNTKIPASLLKAEENLITQDILARGGSPLYGSDFMSDRVNKQIDLKILHEPEVLTALQLALGVYQRELEAKGYTALTINSYSSAVNRFLDFLDRGQVIPDFDNKPTHK